MLIQQFFDEASFTFTYLLVDEASKKAALIDPVLAGVAEYMAVIADRGFELTHALDTHVHADHVTGLGKLRELTGCPTYVGLENEVACASEYLSDQLEIAIGGIALTVLYTPGHTNDAFCFLVDNDEAPILFSGDTLLINGCGRTDFQNGNAAQLYQSLHEKLLSLPDETIVYPGHDYSGNTQSTIGKERLQNPRLQLASEAEFVEFMNNLKLPDPKLMDVAVPLNLSCGENKNGDQ